MSWRRDARPGCDSILTELAARPVLGPPALSLQQLLDIHYCAWVRLRAPLPPRLEAAIAAELSRAGALGALPPKHLVYAVSFRLRQAEKQMVPGVRGRHTRNPACSSCMRVQACERRSL